MDFITCREEMDVVAALPSNQKFLKRVFTCSLGQEGLFVAIMTTSNNSLMSVRRPLEPVSLNLNDFIVCLSEYLLAESTSVYMTDICEDVNAVSHIFQAAQTTQVLLCTRSHVSLEIENFYNGMNYTINVSRSQFEEVCFHLFNRVLLSIENILHEAGLDKLQIDDIAVEGEGMLMPKMKEILQGYFWNVTIMFPVFPEEAFRPESSEDSFFDSDSDSSSSSDDKAKSKVKGSNKRKAKPKNKKKHTKKKKHNNKKNNVTKNENENDKMKHKKRHKKKEEAMKKFMKRVDINCSTETMAIEVGAVKVEQNAAVESADNNNGENPIFRFEGDRVERIKFGNMEFYRSYIGDCPPTSKAANTEMVDVAAPAMPDIVQNDIAAANAAAAKDATDKGGKDNDDSDDSTDSSDNDDGDDSENDTSSDEDDAVMDVAPLSLGVCSADGQMIKIIERNSRLPCRSSKIFTTHCDNQVEANIYLYQGERALINHNYYFGVLTLKGLMPMQRGILKFEVTFQLDTKGILKVRARDLVNDNVQLLKLNYAEYQLDDGNCIKMLYDSERLVDLDKQNRDRLLARGRLEDYMYKVSVACGYPFKYLGTTQQWLERNPMADVSALEFKFNEVKNLCKPIVGNIQQQIVRNIREDFEYIRPLPKKKEEPED